MALDSQDMRDLCQQLPIPQFNVQVILHAGPIFVGEDYQCRRQVVTFGETPKAEFRCCRALDVVVADQRKSQGERIFSKCEAIFFSFNQKVPTRFYPPKIGLGQKREKFRCIIRFWKSRWTRTLLWEKKSGKLVAEMTLQAS